MMATQMIRRSRLDVDPTNAQMGVHGHEASRESDQTSALAPVPLITAAAVASSSGTEGGSFKSNGGKRASVKRSSTQPSYLELHAVGQTLENLKAAWAAAHEKDKASKLRVAELRTTALQLAEAVRELASADEQARAKEDAEFQLDPGTWAPVRL